METFVRKVRHKVGGDLDLWVTECPVCGEKALSSRKYGPFCCDSLSCATEFMVMVESWTEESYSDE